MTIDSEVSGIMRANIGGKVNLNVLSGDVREESQAQSEEQEEKRKRNGINGFPGSYLNRTPFVRPCEIMSNKWGDFYAKGSTEQTIHVGIQEAGRGNYAKRKTELPRNGKTVRDQ